MRFERTDGGVLDAVGYVRVSTGGQAVFGLSLDAQKRAVAEEVTRRGWRLAGLASDAASAGSLRGRPGLRRALEDLDAGVYGALVVSKLDRLARSTLDFAGIMERASRNGWRLVVLDLGMDINTPYGEFAASIWAAVAQVERRLISERARESIAHRKALGTFKATPPEVDEVAAGRIVELAGEGLSSRAIARRLTLEGVPAPRGGDRWGHTTVLKVLARERAVSVGNV